MATGKTSTLYSPKARTLHIRERDRELFDALLIDDYLSPADRSRLVRPAPPIVVRKHDNRPRPATPAPIPPNTDPTPKPLAISGVSLALPNPAGSVRTTESVTSQPFRLSKFLQGLAFGTAAGLTLLILYKFITA